MYSKSILPESTAYLTRAALVLALGLFSTFNAGADNNASTNAEKPRRVITQLDDGGKSVILSDGPPGLLLENGVGSYVGELWKIDSLPPTNQAGYEPDSYSLEPRGAGGVSFRIVSIPPQSGKKALSNDEFGMHQTDTIDFITIISGNLYALLDDGQEVLLNPGDTFIQRGTNHAWINRGKQPCIFSAVMVKPAIATGVASH